VRDALSTAEALRQEREREWVKNVEPRRRFASSWSPRERQRTTNPTSSGGGAIVPDPDGGPPSYAAAVAGRHTHASSRVVQVASGDA